jgi:hypothetical protein
VDRFFTSLFSFFEEGDGRWMYGFLLDGVLAFAIVHNESRARSTTSDPWEAPRALYSINMQICHGVPLGDVRRDLRPLVVSCFLNAGLISTLWPPTWQCLQTWITITELTGETMPGL